MKDNDRLEWFPCYPTKLLGGLIGLSSQEQLTYLIVLLRIFDVNGPCRDDVERLSRLTRLSRNRITKCLDRLVELGKLYRTDDGIMNTFAEEVLAESKAIRDERRIAGRSGGIRSGESRRKKIQQNQGKMRSEASVLLEANGKQNEHPYSNSNSKKDSLPKGRAQEKMEPELELVSESVAMKDPPLDAEADYYRRGKEVLGHSSGGMLTKLLLAKGRNLALARAAIEQASTRGDAREYVGAMIRNGGTNERVAESRTNGAHSAPNSAPTRGHTFVAAMGRTLARRRAERAADDTRRQDIRGGSGSAGGSDA